jgi:hypothetical protein
VIVVLGGRPEPRPFEAERLFHLGFANRILLMNPKPTVASDLGLLHTEANLDLSVLSKKETPLEDIIRHFGHHHQHLRRIRGRPQLGADHQD